jgi:hypothetical protein
MAVVYFLIGFFVGLVVAAASVVYAVSKIFKL